MSRNILMEALSLAGCMLYNTALGSCTHDNPVKNAFCCLCLPQAFIPLSYAAQIPTTPKSDLANVRLSVANVDHQVPQNSAWVVVSLSCARMCKEVCVQCSVFSVYACVHV